MEECSAERNQCFLCWLLTFNSTRIHLLAKPLSSLLRSLLLSLGPFSLDLFWGMLDLKSLYNYSYTFTFGEQLWLKIPLMDSLELLINVFSEKNTDFGAKDSNYGSITDLGYVSQYLCTSVFLSCKMTKIILHSKHLINVNYISQP